MSKQLHFKNGKNPRLVISTPFGKLLNIYGISNVYLNLQFTFWIIILQNLFNP